MPSQLGEQPHDESVARLLLVVVVVLAAIAGIAAAVLPGRRAAKLDVLKAVVSE